jgi:hypothetical protein
MTITKHLAKEIHNENVKAFDKGWGLGYDLGKLEEQERVKKYVGNLSIVNENMGNKEVRKNVAVVLKLLLAEINRPQETQAKGNLPISSVEELNNSEYAKKGLLRHNPEDNIPKGCGKMIEEADRLCGIKYGYYKDEKREYIKKKTDYDIWLCENCSKKGLLRHNPEDNIPKGCGKELSKTPDILVCGNDYDLNGNIILCDNCKRKNCSKKGCGKSFSRGAYTGTCGRSTLKGNIELCPDCRKDKIK